MKRATTLLVALMLGIGSTVFASGSEESDVQVKVLPSESSEIFKLMYLSEDQGLVKVNFYDESGDKIFTDRIHNKKGFLRPYSFEALPKGSYTIELVGPQGVVVEKVQYGTPKSPVNISLDSQDEEKKFKLVVTGVDVDPVLVKIYNERYDLISEDYIKMDKSFSKVYNLSKVPAGSYRFEVISQGNVVSKTF